MILPLLVFLATLLAHLILYSELKVFLWQIIVFPALSNLLFLDIYESTACSYFQTVSYTPPNDAISSITTKELPCYVVKNPFPDLIICILLICVIVTFMVVESHKFAQLKLATQFCIFTSNSPTWKKKLFTLCFQIWQIYGYLLSFMKFFQCSKLPYKWQKGVKPRCHFNMVG